MCSAVTSTNDNNSVMQYDKINVVVSVALRQTNNRKVVGSMTANVVCIIADRGKLSAVAGHHSFFRAVRSWSCQR